MPARSGRAAKSRRQRRRAGGGIAALWCLLVLAAPSAPTRAAEPRETLVFAAVSLTDVFQELGRAFEATHGRHVAFHFAASNDLARQIAAGAPADLLVAANREQIDGLAANGLAAKRRVDATASAAIAGNSLVVVVPAGSTVTKLDAAGDLRRFDRLALADPALVPAGIYARQWLESTGVWLAVAERVVPVLDVRAALAAVAAGDLPAGVVYATDARTSSRVRVVYTVPPGEGPQVRYWAVPVAGGEGAALGEAFLAFLRSEPAAAILRAHGFDAPIPPDQKAVRE